MTPQLLDQIATFERDVVAPAVGRFAESRAAALHRVELTGGRHGDPAAQRVVDRLLAGEPATAASVRPGAVLVAVARDGLRRMPAGHGVFAWTVEYAAIDGAVRARPAAAYRLNVDAAIHRFPLSFADGARDHALGALDQGQVARQLAAAFWFYDRFADQTTAPFPA